MVRCGWEARVYAETELDCPAGQRANEGPGSTLRELLSYVELAGADFWWLNMVQFDELFDFSMIWNVVW